MSFVPIKFNYIPPPTIPPQAVLSPSTNPVGVVVPISNAFGSNIAAASTAAALITQLSNLSATALYLQQTLLSLVKSLGVTFDLSANPALGQALARIYNTTSPPSSMDMQMYTTLLQTDINFLQFDLLNPPDSPVEVQPVQRADVSLVTKAFENSLISSGVYNQTLPILLRPLAGDQVIFNSLTSTLQKYPILAVPQLTPAQLAATSTPTSSSDRDLNGSSVDVGTALASTLSTILNQYQSTYAGIYNVLATPDPTETALPSIVSTLATQPSADLNRLLAMLQNLIAFQQQPALQNAHDSVDNLVIPRLLSDVTSYAGNLDYVSQVAIGPSSGFGSSLGSLMSLLSSVNIGAILGIGITGTVAQASGGYNTTPLTTAQTTALEGIPEGLQILGANVAWSQNESTNQSSFIMMSIQRLGLRRTTNLGNTTEMLTSLKSLNSEISVVQAVLQSGINMPPVAAGNTGSLSTTAVTPAVGLASFGTLVSSLQSQSGSSYSLDGSTLTITPPQIPTAPSNVQSTLTSGGVNQITTQQLQTVVNFNV